MHSISIISSNVFTFILLMAFVGCDGGGSLTERNKALVREYAREEDKGGIDFIEQYIDPHFVFHYPNRVKLQGLERLNKSVVNFQKSFPDGKHTILDQIAEGDKWNCNKKVDSQLRHIN